MLLFVGCLWAYCITETLAAFMQTCTCFAENHFLSISIFFSKIICRIFSPRSVWEPVTLCPWDTVKECSPHAFIFDLGTISLSLGFINKYLVWCYWMLKNVPWMLVTFKTSSRKINILNFISNQTIFLLGKLWNLVQNPWPFLGPSWEVDRDSGPLQHFLRVPRDGTGQMLGAEIY